MDRGMVFVVLFVLLDAFVDAGILPGLGNVFRGDARIGFPENTDDETFGSQNRMELAWMFLAKILISCCPFAWVHPFRRNFHAYAIAAFPGFANASIAFGAVRFVHQVALPVAHLAGVVSIDPGAFAGR